jgi:hypothetical protein
MVSTLTTVPLNIDNSMASTTFDYPFILLRPGCQTLIVPPKAKKRQEIY